MHAAPVPAASGPGDSGANGTAFYQAGTASADAELTALVGATVPKNVATRQIVATRASGKKAVDDARAAGATYDAVQGQ